MLHNTDGDLIPTVSILTGDGTSRHYAVLDSNSTYARQRYGYRLVVGELVQFVVNVSSAEKNEGEGGSETVMWNDMLLT